MVGAWVGVQRCGQQREPHHGAAAGAMCRIGVDGADVGAVGGGVDHSGGIVGVGDTHEAMRAAFEFGIIAARVLIDRAFDQTVLAFILRVHRLHGDRHIHFEELFDGMPVHIGGEVQCGGARP